ncbi:MULTISPECIES: hypothetical protein [unclassified Mesorhizobium]|uniref:hypothetical protein n=1 Tax=unclassified Mesorhizobium TaxID=325217 RepID=UPI000FCC408A|nr:MULTISPECIES: hypothetical protein [unclassified Mesorhizobium]RUW26344.1 hypothetical protein EOA34_08675 [Mesorhizobium sp. M4B.F.Ca.ET.013.02.1.1]RVD21167.1 hypothetical protein EN738_19730 [Mesorhizobium sp. M4B.F.Ca.ET.017.02.2.1]
MQAIAMHIHASAEARKQCDLEDWKLISQKAEFDAMDAMDDALVALCAAQPKWEVDRVVWQKYLLAIDLPAKIDGQAGLTARVLKALISGKT